MYPQIHQRFLLFLIEVLIKLTEFFKTFDPRYSSSNFYRCYRFRFHCDQPFFNTRVDIIDHRYISNETTIRFISECWKMLTISRIEI
mmetsp:Transcript_3362/g.5279  ORF Transcript_3362/g.5279 Transcript_3362/m.5279 type:complete len:87 (+) Transcript_3362:3439-3699(+)